MNKDIRFTTHSWLAHLLHPLSMLRSNVLINIVTCLLLATPTTVTPNGGLQIIK